MNCLSAIDYFEIFPKSLIYKIDQMGCQEVNILALLSYFLPKLNPASADTFSRSTPLLATNT